MIEYKKTMQEIDAIELENINVVSTFSGAGGSCLGYRIAGCSVHYANEFVSLARENYRLNNTTTFIDSNDVRNVKPEDILKYCKDVDIFDGSPPCSAFSTSGLVEDGWDKIKKYSSTAQRVDDLFFEYIRLVEGVKPKIFIAENVTGLVRGKSKGYYNLIRKKMTEDLPDYQVKAFILNASHYGIPQARERLFFIGVRKDVSSKSIIPPKTKGNITVIREFEELDNIKSFMVSGARDKWASAVGKPYPTVTATLGRASRNAHFSANGYIKTKDNIIRRMNLEECKVICSFPVDFKLKGTTSQKYERLGRAVPPIFMANLAKHLIERHLKDD